MTAHTPGPWRVGETLDTPQTRKWTADRRRRNDSLEATMVFARFTAEDQGRGRIPIAECFSGNGREQAHENARLIALAPELVEALRDVYRLSARASCPFKIPMESNSCECNYHAGWKRARALLARLEGGDK